MTRKARIHTMVGAILIASGILFNGWTVPAWLSGIPAFEIVNLGPFIWLTDLLVVVPGILLVRYPEKTKVILDGIIGLVLLFFMLLTIEAGFFLLNTLNREDIRYEGGDYFVEDDLLGYAAAPNIEITSVMIRNGGEVYRADVSTNEFGWRITPTDGEAAAGQFLIFFGDSLTFGYGVDDDETLPYHAANLASGFEPYNFGFNGYGPQNTLALLEGQTLNDRVSEHRGIAVYTFIDDHISRAIGSLRIHNQWGRLMPYYTLDGQGEPVRQGNFMTGRPYQSILYILIGKSQLVRYFGLDFPILRDQHLALVAGMLAESRELLEAQFEQVDFYVLFYPGRSDLAPRLIPYLEEAGIHYLDYADLFDLDRPGLWIEYDGHPTGAGYEAVAERLVDDLGIRSER